MKSHIHLGFSIQCVLYLLFFCDARLHSIANFGLEVQTFLRLTFPCFVLHTDHSMIQQMIHELEI